MRPLLTILITLAFFAFSPVRASRAAAPASPQAQVAERAQALYHVLLHRNARHVRLRDDLAPFFVNDDEMSAFLVRIAQSLSDKGILSNKFEDARVKVLDADAAYGFAETQTDLAADFILCFTRSIDRVDRWKYINGAWYVNPPPLQNLDFE